MVIYVDILSEPMRTKIAILWLSLTLAFLAHGQLHFFEKGGVPKETLGLLLFFDFCYIVPLLLAYLTLALREKACRTLNIVSSATFLVMNIYHLWAHLGEPAQIPIVGATVAIVGLILWHSLEISKTKR